MNFLVEQKRLHIVPLYRDGCSMKCRFIFFVLLNNSMVEPALISMPFFAALPTPTITAVGVAKPIAQGQEITKTAIALSMEF